MKVAVPVILALLAFVALVLALNVAEVDYYPNSLPGPPADPLNIDPPPWLPDVLSHPCAKCGECEHKLEMTACRMVATVHDHDGWHRLFWAGDDDYHYDDAVFFAAAFRNPSALSFEGTWVMEGRFVAPHHDHKCVPAVAEGAAPLPAMETIGTFRVSYRLVAEPQNPDDSALFPKLFHWITYRYEEGDDERFRSFGWQLEEQEITPLPCPCSD